MPTSPLGMSFTEVDEAIQSPALCPLHFLLPQRPQALWPGCAAGLGELQAGCHVLWSPQTAACSHSSALHSLGKYILPLAPRLVCLCPKCLTQLSEKKSLKYLFVVPLPFLSWGFPGNSVVKNPPDTRDLCSIPGSGRTPGGEIGTCFSILARKIPWTEELGRLAIQSTGCKESDTTERLSLQACSPLSVPG